MRQNTDKKNKYNWIQSG